MHRYLNLKNMPCVLEHAITCTDGHILERKLQAMAAISVHNQLWLFFIQFDLCTFSNSVCLLLLLPLPCSSLSLSCALLGPVMCSYVNDRHISGRLYGCNYKNLWFLRWPVFTYYTASYIAYVHIFTICISSCCTYTIGYKLEAQREEFLSEFCWLFMFRIAS